MIESFSHDRLLDWVNEASDDPCQHLLVISVPHRGKRHGFIHETERHARILAMQFQGFDPDLVTFHSIRPAKHQENAFEESI